MKCTNNDCYGGMDYRNGEFKDGKWSNLQKCDVCGGTGEVEPIKEVCEIKQLTLDQLRDQFEKNYLYQSCIPTIRTNFPKNIHGRYKFSQDQTKWECYQACAKLNGILKQ